MSKNVRRMASVTGRVPAPIAILSTVRIVTSTAAAEERLIGQIQHLARQDFFTHVVAETAGDGDDRVAGDAAQDRRAHRRRVSTFFRTTNGSGRCPVT
jgi:hypothetical protein